jgi:hemoglobin
MVTLRVASADSYTPTAEDTPFMRVGGEDAVKALVEAFYDDMEQHEPALAAVHRQDEPGKVSRGSRDRFALFLIGWLGGPQTYTEQHGHPRLRMRHARVPVGTDLRDAWLRSMGRAMDKQGLQGAVRAFLATRFAEVADFLRNVPGEGPGAKVHPT